MDDEPDAALIAASIDHPARFGPIFDRHATVLHRYLVRRIGPDDADSLVGEVFRIAFEKRRTYDPSRASSRASARPWLYGIATNLVAKHRRSEARRYYAMARLAAQRLPAPSSAASSSSVSDEVGDRVSAAVDAQDRWLRVAAAVDGLPPPERDALILHVWEGLSYKDVAAALGVPVGTVRSRLNRARGRLHELAVGRGGEQVSTSTDRRDPGRIGS